ncbi:CBS domain-containing protein [Meridianimarinicoccus aquatilis]|uniref:CBS domain-containing protein n=1 Tax=Meridianimarinicoccus aquatilis TaxID=2552766 RepID=A0A4R6B5D7_9RHOB|nr:CBS domain-containing protein [Fluviibacterium aquatile]QIE42299.1 CBS domain-containing protein [Rhodobacteraceae bacterium SC52]TDL91298.1 CBS domain-containing protein [Fluviibacterium aquatile]
MRVQQILQSKATTDVVTVAPGSSVEETAKLLSSRRIGAVIVSTNGDRAEGIVSERDIVRELGSKGASCMGQTVDTIMTANPISCGLEDSSDDLFRKMTEGRFRHLPVVDADGKMVGLLSIGDVVKTQLAHLEMEKDALQGMIMGF